jgi:hypothetical protein
MMFAGPVVQSQSSLPSGLGQALEHVGVTRLTLDASGTAIEGLRR